jgi:hypothetical protein
MEQCLTSAWSYRGARSKSQEMVQKPRGKKCLALDLDETLVHSSFQVCPAPLYLDILADFVAFCRSLWKGQASSFLS